MTNSIHQHRITNSASNPTGSTITNTTTTTNTTNSTTITNSTNHTNLTSTNTNTGANAITADNATNPEDSSVFEISEADFLARVAAFERNEQREAKRANALMERFLARERARDQSTPSARKSQPPPPSSALPAVSASPVSSGYYNPSGSIPNAAAAVARGPIPISYINGVSTTSATNTLGYEVPPGLVDITNVNGNDRAYRPNRQRSSNTSSNSSSIVPLNNVSTSTLTTTTLSTTKRGLPIIQPDSGTMIHVQFPASATQSIGERDLTTTRESREFRESKKSKKHQYQDRDQDDKRDVKQKLANRTNGVYGSNQNELYQARAVACSGPRQFSSPIQGIVESTRKLQLHKVSIVSGKDDKENKENMHVLRVYQHRPPAIRLDSMGDMLSPTDPVSPTTPTTPNERRTESQLSHSSQPKLGHAHARLSSPYSSSNEKTTRGMEGVESEAKVKKGLRTSFDVCSTLGLSRKSTATPAAAKAYSESARDVHPTNRAYRANHTNHTNGTNGTDRTDGNGDYGKGTLRIGGTGIEEDSDEDEVYAHPHLHSHLHLRGGVHPPLGQRLSKPRCKAQSQSGSLTSKDLTRIFTRAHPHEPTQYDQYGLVKSKYPEFDMPSYNRTQPVHRISRSVLASSQRVNIPLRA